MNNEQMCRLLGVDWQRGAWIVPLGGDPVQHLKYPDLLAPENAGMMIEKGMRWLTELLDLNMLLFYDKADGSWQVLAMHDSTIFGHGKTPAAAVWAAIEACQDHIANDGKKEDA